MGSWGGEWWRLGLLQVEVGGAGLKPHPLPGKGPDWWEAAGAG